MPALQPQGIYSKIIGTPGGTPFTTWQVATGAALDNCTHFHILRARVSVVGLIGSSWVDLDPHDDFVWQYWRDYGRSMSAARMAHHFRDIPQLANMRIATGLTVQTGVDFDVSNLMPTNGGAIQVDAIFLEMIMYS